MPKIVDKEQKRKDIALTCQELLLEKGIKNLTVAEVAQTAGIGKGTVYQYFENKEDIVYEIIRSHIFEYHEEVKKRLSAELSTKEKVFYLFDFVLSKNKQFVKHQEIYKEYLSINLASKQDGMHNFNQECSTFFIEALTYIIEEGIQKRELIEESTKIISGLLAAEKGFLLMAWTEDKEIKVEFEKFLHAIFDLIKIRGHNTNLIKKILL